MWTSVNFQIYYYYLKKNAVYKLRKSKILTIDTNTSVSFGSASRKKTLVNLYQKFTLHSEVALLFVYLEHVVTMNFVK